MANPTQEFLEAYQEAERERQKFIEANPTASLVGLGLAAYDEQLLNAKKDLLLCFVDMLLRQKANELQGDELGDKGLLAQLKEILTPGSDPLFYEGDVCCKVGRRLRDLFRLSNGLPNGNTILAELNTVFNIDQLGGIFGQNRTDIRNNIAKGDQRALSPRGLMLTGVGLIVAGIVGGALSLLAGLPGSFVAGIFVAGIVGGIATAAAGMIFKGLDAIRRRILSGSDNKEVPWTGRKFSGTIDPNTRIMGIHRDGPEDKERKDKIRSSQQPEDYKRQKQMEAQQATEMKNIKPANSSELPEYKPMGIPEWGTTHPVTPQYVAPSAPPDSPPGSQKQHKVPTPGSSPGSGSNSSN